MCILSANISLLQRPRLRVHPSPRWIESTMKELMDTREYEQASNLFDPHSSSSTDIARTVPLKACTKLHDTQRGRKIHRLLSDRSLRNSSIQTSLTHFYSTLPFRSLGSTRLTISVLLVQSNDVDRARQIFESIDRRTVFIYGAMFKGSNIHWNKSVKQSFVFKDTSSMECLRKYRNCFQR